MKSTQFVVMFLPMDSESFESVRTRIESVESVDSNMEKFALFIGMNPKLGGVDKYIFIA